MKTLILYATKYGAACEIARHIADKTGDALLHDLKQKDVPALSQFDCVILGSSLYAGMIRKEAKEYLAQNARALSSKRLGLFLSGMNAKEEKKYWEDNFPSPLLQAAKSVRFLGGIFDPGKAGMLERFLMKAIAKQTSYQNTIHSEAIAEFVKDLFS